MEKHEFKPKEWVLVRDGKDDNWHLDIYSHMDDDYICVGNNWMQCIPFEGNEHLLGTSDSPEEKPNEEFKFGDKVKCREDGEWMDGLFIMDDHTTVRYLVYLPEENDTIWLCEQDIRHA